MKRLLFLFLVLFALTSAKAENFSPIYKLPESAPKLNQDGFLDDGYYLLEDSEKGEWTYIDKDLFINIRRFKDIVERNRKLIWFEAEIRHSDKLKLHTVHANPEQIGRRFMYAEDFAKKINSVFAISDDFYGFRVYQKRRPGIIIQDGKILANNGLKKSHYSLPTYDVLALFSDGSMKSYTAGSIDAETLLKNGARDSWCFGPVLLQNSQIGTQVLNKQFEHINPRQAIGMISPRHYVVMTVEGRSKKSDGVGLIWLSERMKSFGCKEAMNLDGGNSVKLTFMGKLLNSNDTEKTKSRSLCSMISIGTFEPNILEK